MMKIIIPYFENKISTVFDFSENFLIIEYEDKKEIHRRTIEIKEETPLIRSGKLSRTGVELIICGAISQRMFFLLRNSKIEIIPFITGEIEEVLNAYLRGTINQEKYLLPGCPKGDQRGCCKKRYRNGRKIKRKEV